MNKITVRISGFVMLFIVLLFVPSESWSSSNTKSKAVLSDSEMRLRIDNLVGPIDYRYTSKVKSAVEGYVHDYRKGAEELLGRVTIYFPVFEQKIREKNLPEELKYLSIIESALKVDAYSRVGAAGLWQFMRGTAREYGLTVSKSFDQRYSVEESTEAALEYLTALHGQFGDWTLAMAAYNCGPGNVRKAMRRSGKKDYWGIRKYLPRETQNYIPKFVAASYLMAYYYEHDLMPVRPENFYFETSRLKVYQHLSFREISKITDTPVDVIRQLNPSYRKLYIPANTRGMKLVLPRKSMSLLLADSNISNVQKMEDNEINFNAFIREYFHPEIASYLMIESNEKLSIDPLPILNAGNFGFYATTFKPELRFTPVPNPIALRRKNTRSKQYLEYRLKTGETLMDVVKKYPNINIESLIRINNIDIDEGLLAGSVIKIREK